MTFKSLCIEVKLWARRPTICKCLFGPLSTPYKQRTHTFIPPLLVHSFLFRRPVLLATFKSFVRTYASSPSPYLSMRRNTPGPWQLEEVKTRLRAEQVQRENAASARYRPDVKKSSCQCSVVLVLSACCLLLSFVALVLSTVVLRLASKKEEWKDR